MPEATLLEQKLKSIRLKIEEGRDGEAIATLDALPTETSKEERDIIFTRAWYFAYKEQWDQVVALLSPYYDSEEIETNWHAASLKERERRAIYLLWLGNAAVNYSYYQDAASYYQRCLSILDMRRVHLPRVRVRALLGYAMTCIPLGLYPLSVQHYEKALQVSEKEKLPDDLPHIYYGLTDAHRLAGHFGEAYHYGKLALGMYRERGDRYHECRMLNLIGRIALQLGDNRAAADYYMDSLSIATLEDYVGMRLINFVALAELRLDEGRLDEARQYCKDAHDLCVAIKDDHHICGLMYMTHGKVAQREASQQQDEPARKRLLHEALDWYDKARDHFDRTQADAPLQEMYGRLAEVYEALQRPAEALECWKHVFPVGMNGRSPAFDE